MFQIQDASQTGRGTYLINVSWQGLKKKKCNGKIAFPWCIFLFMNHLVLSTVGS